MVTKLSREAALKRAQHHETWAQNLRSEAAAKQFRAATYARWGRRWRAWAEDTTGTVPYPSTPYPSTLELP